MEGIAKKKARHLQEEEMAKASMLNHPEELKEITIKHRNKEMKDMVKADADYLKVIFDKMPTPSISITV